MIPSHFYRLFIQQLVMNNATCSDAPPKTSMYRHHLPRGLRIYTIACYLFIQKQFFYKKKQWRPPSKKNNIYRGKNLSPRKRKACHSISTSRKKMFTRKGSGNHQEKGATRKKPHSPLVLQIL
jgi:hypothetical protein